MIAVMAALLGYYRSHRRAENPTDAKRIAMQQLLLDVAEPSDDLKSVVASAKLPVHPIIQSVHLWEIGSGQPDRESLEPYRFVNENYWCVHIHFEIVPNVGPADTLVAHYNIARDGTIMGRKIFPNLHHPW
jgi:hypothetical protein